MQQLTGWLIFFLSCIGHTELWVMIVNRSHAFSVKARYLRMFRMLHDMAIVIFPWLLLWNCGLGSRGLLTGGLLSEQTAFWRISIIITVLGTIPCFLGILRWQSRRRFEFYKVATREVFDVAAIAHHDTTLRNIRGSRWHPCLPGRMSRDRGYSPR